MSRPPADIEFETRFYEGVHRRDPRFPDVIAILGGLYTKQGRIADGLKMDRKLVRLRPELDARNSSQISRLWLWAASDNLRLQAQNAVACALDLRRLRPQGTVQ